MNGIGFLGTINYTTIDRVRSQSGVYSAFETDYNASATDVELNATYGILPNAYVFGGLNGSIFDSMYAFDSKPYFGLQVGAGLALPHNFGLEFKYLSMRNRGDYLYYDENVNLVGVNGQLEWRGIEFGLNYTL